MVVRPCGHDPASLRTMTVNGHLHHLHHHDLATAYQISENIVVLYRARRRGRGRGASGQGAAHPYTRLLISSIPVASASEPGQRECGARAGTRPENGRCRFADRCPPRCRVFQARPPLFQSIGYRRLLLLYQRSHALAGGDGEGVCEPGSVPNDGESAVADRTPPTVGLRR